MVAIIHLNNIEDEPAAVVVYQSFVCNALPMNILDVATTSPSHEANPVTLYLWGQIGILLSAWVKIGLVSFFGILCAIAKKVAAPHEWRFSHKVFKAMLIILVAYYAFVVTVNLVVLLSTMAA